MKGKASVSIGLKNIQYNLEFTRNISVINGDSGTGKTGLIRLIDSYLTRGRKAGVHCSSNVGLALLRPHMDYKEWERVLHENNNCLVFADENVDYVKSKLFAKEYRTSNNYLVLIGRDRFPYLTYSVDSIYTMVSERKGTICINSLFKRYLERDYKVKPD